MSKKIDFIKSSSCVFVTRVLVLLFGFSVVAIVARILGPSGKGIYSLFIYMPMLIATFGNVGIGVSNVYFIGGSKYSLDRIILNSILFAIIVSTILILLVLPFRSLLMKTALNGLSISHVYMGLCMVPILLINSYLSMIILGQKRINTYNLTNLFRSICVLVFIAISLFVVKTGVLGVMLSWMLAQTALCGLVIVLLRKHFSTKMRLDARIMKKSVSFGLKAHFGTLVQFFNYRLDFFLVNIFLGVGSVGLYSVAVSMSEILWYLPSALALVLFPKVASEDVSESRRFTPVVCRNGFFFSILGGVALLFSGRLIVSTIFGKSFLPALTPLLILLPGTIALGIPKILSSDLTGRGRPLLPSYGSAIGLVITVVLDIVLIPVWGIRGAALASTIAYSTTSCVILFSYLRVSKNRLLDTVLIQPNDFARLLQFLRSKTGTGCQATLE